MKLIIRDALRNSNLSPSVTDTGDSLGSHRAYQVKGVYRKTKVPELCH